MASAFIFDPCVGDVVSCWASGACLCLPSIRSTQTAIIDGVTNSTGKFATISSSSSSNDSSDSSTTSSSVDNGLGATLHRTKATHVCSTPALFAPLAAQVHCFEGSELSFGALFNVFLLDCVCFVFIAFVETSCAYVYSCFVFFGYDADICRVGRQLRFHFFVWSPLEENPLLLLCSPPGVMGMVCLFIPHCFRRSLQIYQ